MHCLRLYGVVSEDVDGSVGSCVDEYEVVLIILWIVLIEIWSYDNDFSFTGWILTLEEAVHL